MNSFLGVYEVKINDFTNRSLYRDENMAENLYANTIPLLLKVLGKSRIQQQI